MKLQKKRLFEKECWYERLMKGAFSFIRSLGSLHSGSPLPWGHHQRRQCPGSGRFDVRFCSAVMYLWGPKNDEHSRPSTKPQRFGLFLVLVLGTRGSIESVSGNTFLTLPSGLWILWWHTLRTRYTVWRWVFGLEVVQVLGYKQKKQYHKACNSLYCIGQKNLKSGHSAIVMLCLHRGKASHRETCWAWPSVGAIGWPKLRFKDLSRNDWV